MRMLVLMLVLGMGSHSPHRHPITPQVINCWEQPNIEKAQWCTVCI